MTSSTTAFHKQRAGVIFLAAACLMMLTGCLVSHPEPDTQVEGDTTTYFFAMGDFLGNFIFVGVIGILGAVLLKLGWRKPGLITINFGDRVWNFSAKIVFGGLLLFATVLLLLTLRSQATERLVLSPEGFTHSSEVFFFTQRREVRYAELVYVETITTSGRRGTKNHRMEFHNTDESMISMPFHTLIVHAFDDIKAAMRENDVDVRKMILRR